MSAVLEQQNIRQRTVRTISPRAVLGLLIALSLGILSLGVNRPLLGNFTGRSIPYADVARTWAQGQAPWFLPTSSTLLVNGQPALMMLDYPLISCLAASLHKASDIPIDACGRLLSIAATAIAMLFLYGIVRRFTSVEVALWTTFFFALSPLTIIYGQSFQANMLEVSLALGSLWLFQRNIASGGQLGWIAIAGLLWGLAMLSRTFAAVLFVPLFVLAWQRYAWKALWHYKVVVLLIVASILPLMWYSYSWWLTTLSSSVHWTVLFQAHSTELSKFFHLDVPITKFLQSLAWTTATMLLNPLGFVFLLVGFRYLTKKDLTFYVWFILGALFLLSTPAKLYVHNYYFLDLIPMVSFFAAKGFTRLVYGGWKRAAVVSIVLVLSLKIAWNPAFITPAHDQDTLQIAEELKEHTPSSSRIILATRSSSLMYYAERRGWHMQIDRPILPLRLRANAHLHDTLQTIKKLQESFETIPDIIEYYQAQRADYLAVTQVEALKKDTDLRAFLENHYNRVYESPTLVLYKLSISAN